MEYDNQEILKRLDKIQIDINFIKSNMTDPDCIMSPEEKDEYEESLVEYRQGKTISLEQLEKEINSGKKK